MRCEADDRDPDLCGWTVRCPHSRLEWAVMEDTILVLEDIRKSFGDPEVWRGVNVMVQPGQHVVIFGPSGTSQ